MEKSYFMRRVRAEHGERHRLEFALGAVTFQWGILSGKKLNRNKKAWNLGKKVAETKQFWWEQLRIALYVV